MDSSSPLLGSHGTIDVYSFTDRDLYQQSTDTNPFYFSGGYRVHIVQREKFKQAVDCRESLDVLVVDERSFKSHEEHMEAIKGMNLNNIGNVLLRYDIDALRKPASAVQKRQETTRLAQLKKHYHIILEVEENQDMIALFPMHPTETPIKRHKKYGHPIVQKIDMQVVFQYLTINRLRVIQESLINRQAYLTE